LHLRRPLRATAKADRLPAMTPIRRALRRQLARVLSAVPPFRGKGRLTMFLDGLLTDYRNPESYVTTGRINGDALFSLDLRAWSQKFAFYYGEWEGDLILTMRSLYRGGTFIDVGSSLGLYAVCVGKSVLARGGSVVAIEPVPLNLARQRVNLELNALGDRVEVMPVALGDHEGVLPMTIDPTGADNNAFFREGGAVTAPLTTLDRALLDRADLAPVRMMKIDVEGYESFILAGGERLIRRDRPVILAEFCRERMAINGCSMEEAWETLTSWGYRAFHLKEGRLDALAEPGDFENLFLIPEEQVPEASGLIAA
jgi:FkbM family methyltransferase